MKSRPATIAAILAFALLLNGCVPIDSLFPLYKADDAVFDDRLLGTWQPVAAGDSDKDERWYTSRSEGEKFYDVRWGATGTKGGFFAKARLTRLANNLFINFEDDSKKIDDGPRSISSDYHAHDRTNLAGTGHHADPFARR
jgi:hypothetical protein